MSSRYDLGTRVSKHTLLGNLLLTIVKAVAGFSAGSAALLADAVHSGSDVLSTAVVLYGLKVAKEPPDDKHPYGHGRAEAVAAKVLSLMLIFVGLEMIIAAVRTVISGDVRIPGQVALWAALLSILVKEGMYRYTVIVGRRIESQALIADAWHHRSDALSSVASFLGVFFARLGYPVVDPIVAGLVALFVIRLGWNIFTSAVDEMMDAQVDSGTIDSVAKAALKLDDVISVHDLRVHRYGSELHVDMKIKASPSLSLVEGHDLVHKVESSISKAIPNCTHVDIHLEPRVAEEEEKI
ncbi:MAG: cation transporter [Firmicutes bacterium]|nr:cation transporter [Bacillota bacterium]